VAPLAPGPIHDIRSNRMETPKANDPKPAEPTRPAPAPPASGGKKGASETKTTSAAWTIDVVGWQQANIKSLRLMVDEANLRLAHQDTISARTSDRAYTLINILIPIIAVLLSLMLGIIPLDERGLLDHLTDTGLVVVFTPVFFALAALIVVVRPGVQYPPGRSPRESFHPGFLRQELQIDDPDPGPPFRSMLLNQLEHMQAEIEKNDQRNRARIRWLGIAIYTLSIWLLLLLAMLMLMRRWAC
jgi:hypothetical protein